MFFNTEKYSGFSVTLFCSYHRHNEITGMTAYPETQHYFMLQKGYSTSEVIQYEGQQGPIYHKEVGAGDEKMVMMRSNVYDPFAIYSKLRKPITDVAYLDRVHCGYKLVFPLPHHHISFLHVRELVNYIRVFLIVFLVCMF